jgi:thiosulfate dehydrogenase [quinone] large subunit
MASVNKNVIKGFHALALVRISIGFIFLWAFVDKFFGLGFSTCRDAATNMVHAGCSQAWVQGGSPTAGFLGHATKGPLADFYQNLAGHSWVDYAFMAGLLGIGVALVLGIGVRLATTFGMLLLLLMWSAELWPAQNPVLDEHIVYIFVLATINMMNSQQKWGYRDWWLKQSFVKQFPFFE